MLSHRAVVVASSPIHDYAARCPKVNDARGTGKCCPVSHLHLSASPFSHINDFVGCLDDLRRRRRSLGRCGLALRWDKDVAGPVVVCVDLGFAEVDGRALGGIWDRLLEILLSLEVDMKGGIDTVRRHGITHQLLKNTLVERPLFWSALPQLLVVVLEALPVLAERLEAGLVDVVNDAPGAAGDAAALLEALELALARVVVLALHVVVVVGLAAGADEEGSREQRGGAGANLLDLGNGLGQRGGVVQHLLVEAGGEE